MTALALRQALVAVATSPTTPGTLDNPVATTFYWQPDQIAFEATPALVATSPEEDEKPLTLGVPTLGGGSASTLLSIRVDLEYLDAPLDGDDPQDAAGGPMAALETWLETAKANVRGNRFGVLTGGQASWLAVERMRTVVDRPLKDAGRVLYYGCLSVWLRATVTP